MPGFDGVSSSTPFHLSERERERGGDKWEKDAEKDKWLVGTKSAAMLN